MHSYYEMADCYSSLEQVLKNTEFENSQQLKAIQSEKERIETYEGRIESIKWQITDLDKHTFSLKETAASLGKQYIINKDTINSLKSTSSVLCEHEEALKRKLSTVIDEAQQEREIQSNALAKYKAVWVNYEIEYDNMESVKRVREKREKLNSLRREYQIVEDRINEVERALNDLKLQKDHKEKYKILQELINNQLKQNKLREETCQKQMKEKEITSKDHGNILTDQSVESTIYPQSCSEPNESAQQPFIVPSSRLNKKILNTALKEDCSLPSLPMKTNHTVPIQNKSVSISRDTCNIPQATSTKKSSSGFKYKLEMPTLSAPSWRTKKRMSTNSNDTNISTLSTPPPTPSLKCSSMSTKSSLSMPQFSFPVGKKQFPKASNRDDVSGSLEVRAELYKTAKTCHVYPLESKCTPPVGMPSKPLGAHENNTILNLPTKSGILSERPVPSQPEGSPKLPIGSSCNSMPSDFNFKAPKLPVSKEESNMQNSKYQTKNKSATHSTTARPEESESVSNTAIGSDCQNRMEWTSSAEPAVSDHINSAPDSSLQNSNPQCELSEKITPDDSSKLLTIPISSASIQIQEDNHFSQITTGSAEISHQTMETNSKDTQGLEYQIDSYNTQQSECVEFQPDIDATHPDGCEPMQRFDDSQGFNPPSQDFGTKFQTPPQDFSSSMLPASLDNIPADIKRKLSGIFSVLYYLVALILVLFGGDGGFGFGNFGQQSGGFGGGFGMFGGQGQQQDQSSAATSGFSGFSFGSGNASQQGSSGFNLNFGGASDNSSFSFNF